jgi:hypothetical protein
MKAAEENAVGVGTPLTGPDVEGGCPASVAGRSSPGVGPFVHGFVADAYGCRLRGVDNGLDAHSIGAGPRRP